MDGLEIETRKRMVLVGGRSHPELAGEIASHLGIELGSAEIDQFASGEIYVRYKTNLRGADVFIVQTHCTPINRSIMEQLIMVDAAKRASAKRISAVIPFYGYSRQDRKARGREPITARLIADLLTAAGVDRVLTVDLHTGQIQGFFDKPVDHLTATPIIADYLHERLDGDLVVVAPDAGGVHLADKYAQRLHAPLAILHKRRRTDARNVTETLEVVGEVADRRCVLVDDMVDTAGTITGGARALLEHGAADVFAAATHPVLSDPAIDRIKNSPLRELVVTNTLPVPEEKRLENVTVLSIAPLLARTMLAVFEDRSVSEIFQGEN
ncbi:MAG: ribose-phosphate diphosphokinase [Acidobacteria bacterium]|nr:ribose-phosphate diphosphokinase [Acidobacteriota bacterium]